MHLLNRCVPHWETGSNGGSTLGLAEKFAEYDIKWNSFH
jgi:hypothetical protein